jgi:hypothetical protein
MARGSFHRLWLSGTILRNEEQRRLVRLEMYWDGATTPAVAAPIGDFFGVGLGLLVPFESARFSSPEARSYNVTIPMPYRKGAKVLLVNESRTHALVWYDLNYTEVAQHGDDVLYFHATWPAIHLLLVRADLPAFDDPNHPQGGCNSSRRDDVSATAYFYLDRPENDLARISHQKCGLLARPPRNSSREIGFASAP